MRESERIAHLRAELGLSYFQMARLFFLTSASQAKAWEEGGESGKAPNWSRAEKLELLATAWEVASEELRESFRFKVRLGQLYVAEAELISESLKISKKVGI